VVKKGGEIDTRKITKEGKGMTQTALEKQEQEKKFKERKKKGSKMKS